MFFVFVTKVKSNTMVGSSFHIDSDKDFKFEVFQFVYCTNSRYHTEINFIDVYMYDIFTGSWKKSNISIDYAHSEFITNSFEKNVIPPVVEEDIMEVVKNWESSSNSKATSIECINFFMWREKQ